MEITYNSIQLGYVKLKEFRSEAIYSDDKVDYLYTHYAIDVQCVFNPNVTSYNNQNPPVAQAGLSPAMTMTNVRHFLLQPRRQLILTVRTDDPLGNAPVRNLGNIILQGPDANNGPKPISCNVVEIVGSESFLIDYKIEAWVNECPGTKDTTPPLLSNRWTQSHQIDEQFQTTIITSGLAVFRTDLLHGKGGGNEFELVDFYRNKVIPPCPTGYRRVNVKVDAGSENNSLRYETTDREMLTNLGNTMADGCSRVINFESNLEIASITPGEKDSVAALYTQQTCACKVIGDQFSRKWNLTLFAFTIIANKLNLYSNKIFTKSVMIRHSLHDRIVEVIYTIIAPARTDTGIAPSASIRLDKLKDSDEYLATNQNPKLLRIGGGWNQGVPRQGRDPFPAGPLLDDNMTRGPGPFTTNGELIAKRNQYLLQTAVLGTACTTPLPVTKFLTERGQFLPASTLKSKPFSEVSVDTGRDTITNVPDVETGQNGTLLPLTFTPVPNYASSQQLDNFHTDYKCEVNYDLDMHVLQLPTTGGSQCERTSTEYAYTACPSSKKVVKWTGERIGQQPSVPNPALSDSNWILFNSKIIPIAPIIGQNGIPVYRVSGIYEYFAKSYLGAGDVIETSVLPWTTLAYQDQKIQLTDYINGVIDEQPKIKEDAQFIGMNH